MELYSHLLHMLDADFRQSPVQHGQHMGQRLRGRDLRAEGRIRTRKLQPNHAIPRSLPSNSAMPPGTVPLLHGELPGAGEFRLSAHLLTLLIFSSPVTPFVGCLDMAFL